jgi:hypothetical protein
MIPMRGNQCIPHDCSDSQTFISSYKMISLPLEFPSSPSLLHLSSPLFENILPTTGALKIEQHSTILLRNNTKYFTGRCSHGCVPENELLKIPALATPTPLSHRRKLLNYPALATQTPTRHGWVQIIML